jgi:2-haloacid dehalogenase
LEARFPGKGRAIAEKWREKQIEYSRLRTMSSRYVDF